MASTYKIEMRSWEEENLMTTDDNDSNDEYGAQPSSVDSIKSSLEKARVSVYEDEDGDIIRATPAGTADSFITQIITAEDNPTLNPWTFRTWFIGSLTPCILSKAIISRESIKSLIFK
jgi:hypothetical protein